MASEKFKNFMKMVEAHREARDARTDFYESPQNRCVVFTHLEDEETYYERKIVDTNFHETQRQLKKALKDMGKKFELGYIKLFDEKFKKQVEERKEESKNVIDMLKHIGLDNLIHDWNIARSMSAHLRLLERKYPDYAWYKKKLVEKLLIDPQHAHTDMSTSYVF